ncbi:glycosyltransferase family 9 protein [Chryseolinea sp. T2]|uniref:glycosyltransferase family 9 protein n=1 Tax=Chryseolinea sp. T2 TaxID=3129255 RepID=UPI0030789D6B
MTLRKILVIRFSAMGDVVLLVPVIRALVAAYDDVEVTVVTRPKFASFFTDIDRVIPYPADVDYTYTGILGMRDLFGKLMRKASYDVVIDMHDHMRTIILRSLFKLFGVKVVVFQKGRPEKKQFTRKEDKNTQRLPHTVERYRQAFVHAGFDKIQLTEPAPYFNLRNQSVEQLDSWLQGKSLKKDTTWIGVAPFAAHVSKVWPEGNYFTVIEQWLSQRKATFFMFGGGEKDIKFFETLKERFPENIVVVAGELKIKQELALMQMLDLMLCVDSSNMHLAALSGTKLLSIWGGTHPDVGFGPYNYGNESILQISREVLPCRPCSVYGTEKCFRGDFACLTFIKPEEVVRRMSEALA